MANKTLTKAKAAKNDEFYTQFYDKYIILLQKRACRGCGLLFAVVIYFFYVAICK